MRSAMCAQANRYSGESDLESTHKAQMRIISMRLEPYCSVLLPGIQRLNRRFREAGVEEGFLIPESADVPVTQAPFETMLTAPMGKRHFLLLDGEEVRGGVILQDQQCEVNGVRDWVTNIQMPVSEGLVDRRFAHLAAVMIRLILKRTPWAYAVGMGGLDRPFPRFLTASKWHVAPVPFWFYVLSPRRALTELRLLRANRVRAAGARLAAQTGLGWAGIRLLHGGSALWNRWRGQRSAVPKLRTARIRQWDGWADMIWANYRQNCSFAAIRDSTTLPYFHPLDSSLEAYRFEWDGDVVGWSAMQVTSMQNNLHFGDLRVGTILDSLSTPGFGTAVVRSTLDVFRDRRVDLVVANQAHAEVAKSMREAGFLEGPSNYICASSPQLCGALQPFEIHGPRRYVSRGDGDGRIHL